MVHKEDGKDGEKTVAKERKPPPSSDTVFLPSEVIQGSTVDNTGLDLIRAL